MIEVARAAHDAGLCVVPPREDGTKAPEGSWKKYIEQRPDEDQIERWYANGRQGIGVVCGRVSGGLECFEFEATAVAEGLHEEYRHLCEAAGYGELLNRILLGYTEKTPSGGLHILWRCEEIEGNQKLARRPSTPEERAMDPNPIRVLIESRGEGGYAVIAPSNGSVHPSGRPWELLRGGVGEIATITPQERSELLSLARALDRMPKSTFRTPSPSEDDRPGDAFNSDPQAQEHIRRLLLQHGWNEVYGKGEAFYLRRPGKQRGVSATLGYIAPGVFYCFSTSTIFEAEKGYSPFQVYAFLEHGGDFSAAAKALREAGYGERSKDRAEGETRAEEGADGEETGYEPIDLGPAYDGEGAPPTTILHRTDGVALLYPGRINTFQGEPEAGKGWLAIAACVEQIGSGHDVIYMDYEDSEHLLVARLRDEFGASREIVLERVHYIKPPKPFKRAARRKLIEFIGRIQPSLCVIDGVSEAMALDGLDPIKNNDVTAWLQRLPRPIAELGPAVLLIDHVTKDKETRGRWALGAQSKLAGTGGATISVEVIHPFGRGTEGELLLKLRKDRVGYVSEHQVGDQRLIGKVSIKPFDAGGIDISIEPPVPPDEWQPTGIMEQISRLLTTYSDGLSGRGIEEKVTAKRATVRRALKALVDGGYIEIERKGRGGAYMHRLIKPYWGEDNEEVRTL